MLLSLIALPIIGSIVIMSVRTDALIHVLGTLTSLLTFLFSLGLWVFFDNLNTKYQFTEFLPWFGNMNIPLYLGIDGISLFMILLTTFLTLICIAFSFQSIKKTIKTFIVLFLIMESLLIFTFSVLDSINFMFFFKIEIMMVCSLGLGSCQESLRPYLLAPKQWSSFLALSFVCKKIGYTQQGIILQYGFLKAKYKSVKYIIILFLIPNLGLIGWTIFYSDITFYSFFFVVLFFFYSVCSWYLLAYSLLRSSDILFFLILFLSTSILCSLGFLGISFYTLLTWFTVYRNICCLELSLKALIFCVGGYIFSVYGFGTALCGGEGLPEILSKVIPKIISSGPQIDYHVSANLLNELGRHAEHGKQNLVIPESIDKEFRKNFSSIPGYKTFCRRRASWEAVNGVLSAIAVEDSLFQTKNILKYFGILPSCREESAVFSRRADLTLLALTEDGRVEDQIRVECKRVRSLSDCSLVTSFSSTNLKPDLVAFLLAPDPKHEFSSKEHIESVKEVSQNFERPILSFPPDYFWNYDADQLKDLVCFKTDLEAQSENLIRTKHLLCNPRKTPYWGYSELCKTLVLDPSTLMQKATLTGPNMNRDQTVNLTRRAIELEFIPPIQTGAGINSLVTNLSAQSENFSNNFIVGDILANNSNSKAILIKEIRPYTKTEK